MRIPLTTYRLQFNRDFSFQDARELAAYLHEMGVTDVYASPILQARRGSLHGYDVADPSRLNAELGAEADFDALVEELHRRDMGLLLDIVPNHMAASSENPWWMDVLENGPDSPFAIAFDIDWSSAKRTLAHKVLVPVLGGPYGRVLENGELPLKYERRGFFVHYYANKLPLSLTSYAQILSHRLEVLEETYGKDHPVFRDYLDLLATIEHYNAAPPVMDRQAAAGRRQEREAIKKRLWRLYHYRPEIRGFLDENVRVFNGTKGDPESFVLLDRLLSGQNYLLSYWRLANEEINYRRFFAVSDLVSVRAEDPRVFEASHAKVLELAARGKITGLRVDHIDGLHDPCRYLVMLQERLSQARDRPGPFFVIVEKILEPEEGLPAEWPVAGTTGYDFLNLLNGLFVNASGARAMEETYVSFTGITTGYEELVYKKKKLIMDTLLAGEMHALGNILGRLAETDRYARDLPRKELRQAIVEVTACFPVYRTYVAGFRLSTHDRRYIGRALKEAERRRSEDDAGAPVYDFLRRTLLMEMPPYLTPEHQSEWIRFVMRWQQFSGPIMAKGVEDTALYVYNRLVSLNEVGGDPRNAGTGLAAFHRANRERLGRSPATLNATSTHDTKRSEDVRARIDVLSELPEEWEERLKHWHHLNLSRMTRLDGQTAPDRNEEVLLYQTLLGAWPLREEELPAFRERIKDYMIKAVREASVHTQWTRPNEAHEGALRNFIDAILADAGWNGFVEDFLPFQRKVAWYGALNGLSQLLIKIASPGVPDFYQGTELWNFRLVDPDNRRPVDFRKRVRILNEIMMRDRPDSAEFVRDLLDRWEDGRVKFFLTYAGLRFRRARRKLFLEGEYVPLQGTGARREHVVAFARRRGKEWALAAAPRLLTKIVAPGVMPLGATAWGNRCALALPEDAPARWRDVLTGGEVEATGVNGRRSVPLHHLFRDFPVALLEGAAE